MKKSITQVDIFARPQLIICVVGSIDDVTIACNPKNTSMIAILSYPAFQLRLGPVHWVTIRIFLITGAWLHCAAKSTTIN